MKKTLLTMLALFCTFTMMLGVGTACNFIKSDSSTSSSSQMETLKITGRPADDTATITDTVNTLTLGCDEADVTWASSDTAVATVKNGVVTLHSAGSTVISVTKGEKIGDFILTVVDGRIPAPATITITGVPQNGEVQLSSGSVQLSAICSDGSEVVWISHNETVA
ncbi:MAG: hypothetical protein J6S04_00620, partial [Clostridia bacterium]|nr:hypothetical protein [Clostridia bacterium]